LKCCGLKIIKKEIEIGRSVKVVSGEDELDLGEGLRGI